MAAAGHLVPAVSVATVGLPVHHGDAPSPAQYRVHPAQHDTVSTAKLVNGDPSPDHYAAPPHSRYGMPLARHAAPQLSPVPHLSSAQRGHVSAQYTTPPYPAQEPRPHPAHNTHVPTTASTQGTPAPAEHPPFPVHHWEKQHQAPLGPILPPSEPCVQAQACSTSTMHVHVLGDTAGQAGLGCTCVCDCTCAPRASITHVPHLPRVPPGPWGRIWPWQRPCPASPQSHKGLPVLPRALLGTCSSLGSGAAACPPCLSFPSDPTVSHSYPCPL